jgi:hypothetical protein
MNRLAVNHQYQQHSTWPCPYHCRNLPERQDLSLLVAGGTCRPATSSQRSVGTTKHMSALQENPLGRLDGQVSLRTNQVFREILFGVSGQLLTRQHNPASILSTMKRNVPKVTRACNQHMDRYTRPQRKTSLKSTCVATQYTVTLTGRQYQGAPQDHHPETIACPTPTSSLMNNARPSYQVPSTTQSPSTIPSALPNQAEQPLRPTLQPWHEGLVTTSKLHFTVTDQHSPTQ